MCLEAEQDQELRQIIDRAALVVPESSGMLWASRALGYPLKEFTPGVDLMGALCGMAQESGHSVFLLGSAQGVAEEAGDVLRQRYPGLKIVGTYHGFFTSPHPKSPRRPQAERRVRQDLSESEVLQLIRQSKPVFLFVGMGMPAQEKWIARNLEALGVPVVMGVGGSFDVLSGRLKRAPAWMRRRGIEWLYRLAQEPWRWRRIAQLPVFAWHVLKQKWK